MITKWIKLGVLSVAGLSLTGGLLFGKDAVSYLKTSASSVRTSVKNAVPIEFELQRAQNLLEQIIPEMHANIRLIAQEEVEVAGLKGDIVRSEQALEDHRTKICRLRDHLADGAPTYRLAGFTYTRDQLTEDLSAAFDRYKEAEVVLEGKRRLLTTRERSLATAMQMLDRTRSQKVRLEDQIKSLESQYRLAKAAGAGSPLAIDSSKLAKTEKLITEIKTRLDVAERVLAHEARFVQTIPVDTIDEKELLRQVGEYFEIVPSPESQPPQKVETPTGDRSVEFN